jgi:hypothetical protein
LTVNPHTGLPEANFFDDIGLGGLNKALPAIAGAGLSFFSGGAIDPMTAAGMVGGLAGLSSGSLEKGIMAGLGAYGGAGLTSSLSNMGASALTTQAYGAAQSAAETAGLIPGTEGYDQFIQDAMSKNSDALTSASRIGTGFKEATGSVDAATDFIKKNPFAIGAAALPSLMGSMEQGSGPTALTNKGYIRRSVVNPRTGAIEQVEAIPVDEFGNRSAVSFGGVGTPTKYAAGGATDSAVNFGGVGKTTSVIDPNDTRSDSQKAYDYLMGNTGAKNPMLFYHQKEALKPLDMNTRTGGHYVLNADETGYDWVPDAAPATAAPATDAGLAALAAGQQGGADRGSNANGATAGQGQGLASTVSAVGQGLSNLGLPSLGNAVSSFANSMPASEADIGAMNAAANANGSANPAAGFSVSAAADGPGDGPGGDGPGGDGPGTGGAGRSGVGNARGGLMALAAGGLGSLGGYSDGGQLLRGPGDGVSDSIPATIGKGQPARLADGEFVVPARIVSELGNGSTEAGAKQLYAMMARIQAGRAKTTGKNQVATNSKADRHLPA